MRAQERRVRWRAVRAIPASVVVLAAAVMPGAMQDISDPEPADAVEALGSADWAERERASEVLTTSDAWRLVDLEREATRLRASLSPEARVRLAAAMQARFVAEPRAMLGIRYEPARSPDGYPRISDVQEDFLAAGLLQAGDVLISIQGVDMRETSLRAQIMSRDPGDVVAVTVERDGLRVAVDITLSAYPAEAQPTYDLLEETELIEESWPVRWQRLGFEKRIAQPVLRPEALRASEQTSVRRHDRLLEGSSFDPSGSLGVEPPQGIDSRQPRDGARLPDRLNSNETVGVVGVAES